MEVDSSQEQLNPTINVRALITAYEYKAQNPEVPISRPRSNSLGNVLAKNVIVKTNEFQTLDEVKKALEAVEQRLNQYEIYNKEKHVTFQEELFNILTSIFNIDKDDPEYAKELVFKTKNHLSFLNNKLPTYTVSHRYETFSNHISKPNDKIDDVKKIKIDKDVTDISSSVKSGNLDELDSIKPIISVNTLKQKFQVSEPRKEEKKLQIEKKKESKTISKFFKSQTTVVLNNKSVENKAILPEKSEEVILPEEESPVDNKKPPVSVQLLRSIFETKSKENGDGLSLILKEQKPPITRFNYKSSISESTSDEDLKHIHQVSSYLKTSTEETNGLLEILKKEKYRKEESTNDEDSKPIQVSSYIKMSTEETNGSEILKKEKHVKEEFHYDLNINEEDEDTGEKVQVATYLENYDPMANLEYVENSEENDIDDESVSSEDSIKSGNSIKEAVMRVEFKNHGQTNGYERTSSEEN